jgi:hypothetical protein
MRIRFRLGATLALATLLVGLIAAPALAWEWGVKGKAVCEDDGTIRVDWAAAWKVHDEDKDSEGALTVTLKSADGEELGEQTGTLTAEQPIAVGSFADVPADAGPVKLHAMVKWSGRDEAEHRYSGKIELPSDCAAPPSSTVAPTTTVEATTTTEGEDVLGTTSTTAGAGQLPFTGASSGPMLLAGFVLVGGGLLILFVSRSRGRHEAP